MEGKGKKGGERREGKGGAGETCHTTPSLFLCFWRRWLCQANATAAGHAHLRLAFGQFIKDVCTKEGGNWEQKVRRRNADRSGQRVGGFQYMSATQHLRISIDPN